MRQCMRLWVSLAFFVVVAGCEVPRPFYCVAGDDSSCNLDGRRDGKCLLSPVDNAYHCAFLDPGCTMSLERWYAAEAGARWGACVVCTAACSTNHVPTPTCSGTTCDGACEPGWADCDSDKKTNGCEQNISTDPTHCGGCNNHCAPDHVVAIACAGGKCTGDCELNYRDCDNDKLSNGCEANILTSADACGGCQNRCSERNIAVRTCSEGICTGECKADYRDCDGNKLINGCEVHLTDDPMHCGACSTVCSSSHITPACTDGKCNGVCEQGYLSCSGNKQGDGCEVDSWKDPKQCGGCGAAFACPGLAKHVTTPTCGMGLCDGDCEAPWLDCDHDKLANGCEANPTNDPNHCGGCDKRCSSVHVPSPHCGNSLCDGVCEPGWAACKHDKLNSGCEQDIYSDPKNCNGCGTVCPLPKNALATTCGKGACGFTCKPGFADCDHKPDNGCEVDLNVDPLNCGACGNSCPYPHCAGRACLKCPAPLKADEYTWTNWPMPTNGQNALPNPASYDTSTPGLVVDNVTGLVWQADDQLSPQHYVEAAARNYCANLIIDGCDGWRLPTRIELMSIVDHGAASPATYGAFSKTPTEAFWSSSVAKRRDRDIVLGYYSVEFSRGVVSQQPEVSLGLVRCVR